MEFRREGIDEGEWVKTRKRQWAEFIIYSILVSFAPLCYILQQPTDQLLSRDRLMRCVVGLGQSPGAWSLERCGAAALWWE